MAFGKYVPLANYMDANVRSFMYSGAKGVLIIVALLNEAITALLNVSISVTIMGFSSTILNEHNDICFA